MRENDSATAAPGYRYRRYFLDHPRDPQATADDLAEGLFLPNANTPNARILRAEQRRLEGIARRYRIELNEALLGYDWRRMSAIMSRLRGLVYNHVPVLLPDILQGRDALFEEYIPFPERHRLPPELDVFMTSTASLDFQDTEPGWKTRFGLFNQRRRGQTYTEDNGQDAVRTGFWMLPPEVIELAMKADSRLARRAFAIFDEIQLPAGHDGLFHMAVHGIHPDEPHYERLKDWNHLLYGVPGEIRYSSGMEIPNYEMTALRTQRMAFQKAAKTNPAINDFMIDAFVEFERLVTALAERIDDPAKAAHFTEYMMGIFKTPFFHAIAPDHADARLDRLRERHPCITKNNKLMAALHARDTVDTAEGPMHAHAVIERMTSMTIDYARTLGIDPGNIVTPDGGQGETTDDERIGTRLGSHA